MKQRNVIVLFRLGAGGPTMLNPAPLYQIRTNTMRAQHSGEHSICTREFKISRNLTIDSFFAV